MRHLLRPAGLGLVVAVLSTFTTVGAAPAVAQVDPAVTGTLSLFKRIENLDTGASEGRRELWTMTAVNTEDATYTFQGNGLNGVQSTVVPAGAYTISESGGVPGYAFVSWDCGGAGTFTSPTPVVTVPAGGSVTCTVRNDAQQSFLTLRKAVVGGPAAPSSWQLQAQGPTNVTGTDGVRVPVRIGQYQLSEQGGPDGYAPSDWVCTGGQQVSGTSVVVALEQDVVCTVTNTREQTTAHLLTLAKDVVGGPAQPTDFLLTGTGPGGTAQGVSGSPNVTDVPVESGTYTLAESALNPPADAGYTAGPWTCSAGTVVGDTLTLTDADGDVTCRITNTWTGGYLTLVKEVVGGTLIPAAWVLTAAEPGGAGLTGRSGEPAVTHVAVPAGTYTLGEVGPSNYTASPWTCTAGGTGPTTVAVTPGADITCTVTNTIERASLTLVKQVVGGTAAPEDFTLHAVSPGVVMSGTSGSPEVTQVAIETGQTWALAEDPVPGYTPGPWSCTGATAVDDAVAILDPVDVTCTVTNTWTGGTLTLVKDVEGSSASPASWTLTAQSADATVQGTSGSVPVTAVPVPPGDFTLSESVVAGYTASDWDCGVAPVVASVVTVGAGQDVVCTVVNTATQPHLTLTKVVDNGAGGTLPASTWLLAAAGPLTISGLTGDPSVTLAAVVPGTYALSEQPTTTPGYDTSPWVCRAGATALPTVGSTVTIPVTAPDGSPFTEDVVCTVTNTARAPLLTLRKTVDNTGGGQAAPTAWTLLGIGAGDLLVGSTGTAPVTDVPVRAGTYSLLELGPPLYVSDGWSCVSAAGVAVGVSAAGEVTLGLGDDVTCTVHNRWTRAQVTLTKNVAGGPAAATDWTLVGASAIGGFSGVSGTPGATGVVGPGVVTLTEVARTPTAAQGYTQVGWDCGPEHPVAGDQVTVAANDEVTCAVTNEWHGSLLTLAKVVDGGTASATDWTLSAAGSVSQASGTSGSTAVTAAFVVAGGYRLAESTGPAGYRSGGWTCDGGTLLGDFLAMPGDTEVTCTVTNTFEALPPPPPPPVGPVVPDPGTGDDVAAGGLTLAATGSDALAGGVLALTALLIGVGMVVTRRARRARA
ncbi:hypothetical protein Cch01nite_11670 [Cellulomonas chitinilytica]|uniref:SpaA-like prealbumin fold domain-containing protein n=1 Tax=Cellulomonas chitinilytica TaxID=398759 RepID=A0A919P214_9CELL|nr:hypothetical protein [Cellulomonas chitinilytica]GIG20443.1 hypothetical protein Cch01nite_11670 [Cellulomonas chitinilytica]